MAGIVDVIASHLAQGVCKFKIPRRMVAGEDSDLGKQRVFVPTNEYYREYDCPCGNGTARIMRVRSLGGYRYEATCDHEGFMQDFPVAADDVELLCFDPEAYKKESALVKMVDEAIRKLRPKPPAVTVANFTDGAKDVLLDLVKSKGGRPARTKHSLTQRQMAKIFGVSEQTVYKWEHGIVRGPKGYTDGMRKAGDLDGLLKCVEEYNRLKDFKDVLNTKDIIRNGFNEEEIAAVNGKLQDLLRMKRNGEDILKTLT